MSLAFSSWNPPQTSWLLPGFGVDELVLGDVGVDVLLARILEGRTGALDHRGGLGQVVDLLIEGLVARNHVEDLVDRAHVLGGLAHHQRDVRLVDQLRVPGLIREGKDPEVEVGIRVEEVLDRPGA